MESSKIQLVVTDLDDTLLDHKKEISQTAVDMIGILNSLGIQFTFVTGRPPYAVQRFAQRVGITAPIVCCNGAVIFEDGHVLSRHSFSLTPLQGLLEQAVGLGMTVLLYTGDVEYTLSETDWTQQRAKAGRALPLWKFSAKVDVMAEKVNIMAGKEIAAFIKLVSKIKSFSDDYSITVYDNSGCEIVAKNINKATGLAELCRICGVSESQTLAIGDNENDIYMLQAAGIGAAVANAVDNTKRAADYICKKTYADGVVEAVEKFVLSGDE